MILQHVFFVLTNQRTNDPVNAHLRSAVYMNVIENSPSIGAGEALGPLFFQNNQYTVYTFPSNDILTVYPFKYIGNPCCPCLKIGQGHHRVMIYT